MDLLLLNMHNEACFRARQKTLYFHNKAPLAETDDRGVCLRSDLCGVTVVEIFFDKITACLWTGATLHRDDIMYEQ